MFQCDQCSKVYQRHGSFVTHCQMHTNPQFFKCDICHKCFAKKPHLNEHMFTHSAEKLFKCEICESAFNSPGGLRNHSSNVHAKKITISYSANIVENIVKPKLKRRPGRPRKIRSETVGDKSELASTNKHAVKDLDRIDIANIAQIVVKPIEHTSRGRKIQTETIGNKSVLSSSNKSTVENRHRCNICDEHFLTKTKLQNHMDWHSRRKRYKCRVCHRVFKHLSIFRNHRKLHGNESRAKPRVFREQTTSSSKKHVCKLCSKNFSSPYSLARHMSEFHNGVKRVRTDVGSNGHVCNVCPKTFTNVASLQVHIERLHTRKTHVCHICNKAYGFLHDLKCHYSTHSPEGPSQCNVCGRTFHNDSDFKEHNITHVSHQTLENESILNEHYAQGSKPSVKNGRPFSCYVCGRTFVQSSHLKWHCKSKHNIEKPFKCEHCAVAFDRRMLYRKHLKTCLGTSVKKLNGSINSASVGAKGTSKSSFVKRARGRPRKIPKVCTKNEAHIDMETSVDESVKDGIPTKNSTPNSEQCSKYTSYSGQRPYPCYVCGFAFIQSSHLRRHCKTMHNLDNSFKCEICEVTFKQLFLYRRHVCHGRPMTKHIGSVKSVGAKFTSKDALIKRGRGRPRKKKNVHTKNENGETMKRSVDKSITPSKTRAPTCKLCGAEFDNDAALRLHLDIHFDRRPFPCRLCDKKFRQSGHLSAHCKNIHDEDCPYKCDVCDMKFRKKLELISHQRNTHIMLENSDDCEQTSHGSSMIDFKPEQYTKFVDTAEYACEFCAISARRFKSLTALRRHVTIVHSGIEKQPVSCRSGMVESPLKISSDQIYKCNSCSVIVHGWEAVEAHEKEHAKDNRHFAGNSSSMPSTTFTLPTPNIEQTFECKFCGEEFAATSREAFDEHQLDHELAAIEPVGISYFCVECDEEFAMASDLVEHHSKAH